MPTENSVWSLAGPFRPHVTMLHLSNKLPEQRSSTWILLFLWPLDRGDIFGEPQSLILHRRRGYCSFRVQLVAARHTARQKWLRARLDTKRTGRASSLGARTPCEMRHDVGYETGRRRRGRNGDIPGRFHPASGRRLHSNSSLAETGLKTSLELARK